MEDVLHRIEQKLAVIEGRLGDSASQLRIALSYRQSDPQSAVTKCRILLEKLLRDIYVREVGSPPEATMVGQLLALKEIRTTLPRRIHAKMTMVKEMANLGAHGDEVLPRSFLPNERMWLTGSTSTVFEGQGLCDRPGNRSRRSDGSVSLKEDWL
jgi:hypothetical protein